jgi:hypothetical protein
MSQTSQLISLMKRKWVTPQDALRHAGCFRLAARVHDMRSAGINVVDRWVERDDTRFKAYKIINSPRVADVLADRFVAEAK